MWCLCIKSTNNHFVNVYFISEICHLEQNQFEPFMPQSIYIFDDAPSLQLQLQDKYLQKTSEETIFQPYDYKSH